MGPIILIIYTDQRTSVKYLFIYKYIVHNIVLEMETM